MIRGPVLLVGWLVLGWAGPAWGADPNGGKPPSYLRQEPATPTQAAGPARAESSSWRLPVAMALVLGLGSAALFMRARRGKPSQLPNRISMNVVGTLGVGPKAQVTLITVGQEAILLGVTEHGVQPLRAYSPAELGSLALARESHAPTAEGQAPGFDDPATAAPSPAPSRAFQKLLDRALEQERVEPKRKEMPRETRGTEELPPHLQSTLDQVSNQASFEQSEGQASELVRRFREFRA